MSLMDKLQNIDRRYIYLLGWIFVLFPLYIPLGLPVPIGRESLAWKAYIDNIPNDYDPAYVLQLGETGNRAGAFQISGTANTHQIPFFLITTDYCLIGEEIFSAGAYLTNDGPVIASLAGQDIGRIIAVVLSVLGVLLATMGSNLLLDLMGM